MKRGAKKSSVRRRKGTPFRIGDRVVRNKAVGSVAQRGDMAGTILKITAVTRGAGGTRARIRVRWDNGHEASVEDRQLVLVFQSAQSRTATTKSKT